jgi:riboflavin synthase
MFTGIIETVGQVKEVVSQGANKTFWIQSALSSELKIDQSLSHDGVCLTVEDIKGDTHKVTAVAETLKKTSLQGWATGINVNLERSLLLSSRLDGHLVQGHVDATGMCKKIKDANGSREFAFSYPKNFSRLLIEKGSICINGVSLTCFSLKKDSFKVAIIPYTWENTNFKFLKIGGLVNLEFDIIVKYIARSNKR